MIDNNRKESEEVSKINNWQTISLRTRCKEQYSKFNLIFKVVFKSVLSWMLSDLEIPLS